MQGRHHHVHRRRDGRKDCDGRRRQEPDAGHPGARREEPHLRRPGERERGNLNLLFETLAAHIRRAQNQEPRELCSKCWRRVWGGGATYLSFAALPFVLNYGMRRPSEPAWRACSAALLDAAMPTVWICFINPVPLRGRQCARAGRAAFQAPVLYRVMTRMRKRQHT